MTGKFATANFLNAETEEKHFLLLSETFDSKHLQIQCHQFRMMDYIIHGHSFVLKR
jgi:hypothetical protein